MWVRTSLLALARFAVFAASLAVECWVRAASDSCPSR